jgi:hypothetical protein
MAPAIQPTTNAKQRNQTGQVLYSRPRLDSGGEREQPIETRVIGLDRHYHGPLRKPYRDRLGDSTP